MVESPALKDCPECDGLGFLDDDDCEYCEGVGEVPGAPEGDDNG